MAGGTDFSVSLNPGAILGSGLNFIGGLMQQDQAARQFGAQMALSREQMERDNTRFWDSWNTQRWAADTAFDRSQWLQGNAFDRTFEQAQEMYRQQREDQYQFAQNGIRWKVNDAIASGLHPLYALGGGASFSPVNVQTGGSAVGAPQAGPSSGIGQSSLPSGQAINPFSDMGQDLSRAVMATQTAHERQEDAMSDLSKRHIESQINLNNARAGQLQRMVGPSFPDPSSGKTVRPGSDTTPKDNVEVKPAENISPSSLNNDVEAGNNRAVRLVDYPNSIGVLPGKDQNMDDMSSPGYGTYQMQYNMAPMMGAKPSAAVVARAKERWPNAKGLVYIPFMGWTPRYEGDFLDKARRFLVPGAKTGHNDSFQGDR